MIIRESGKMSDALDHLITHEHQIPDKLAVTELKGTCPMQSCQHVFPILELTLAQKSQFRVVARVMERQLGA